MKKIFASILFVLLGMNSVISQTIPLGTPIMQEYLRREQLLGNFNSDLSFNYRPINLNHIKTQDSLSVNLKDFFHSVSSSLKILPIDVRTAYDSNFPDSRNDGAMIRSRGLQTYLSAGVYFEKGPLSIQLKPEYVWAQNQEYVGFPTWPRHWESTWRTRYIWFNRSDLPERYGLDSYAKFFWGQSSLRINKWGMSLGISTENIWWGPSIRNSLMMSHNAAGFPHLTFNSTKPLKSKIGNFEWQFITGRLDGSGYNPPADTIPFEGRIQYSPKPDDWRYFQSLSFTYSPKWVRGLSLGFTRWVQMYSNIAKETNDYFPAFSNLFRKNDNNVTRNELDRDQAAGLFARWVWFDSKAEVYFEFAKNDAAANLRDLIIDTDHSRALTFGFKKLFPSNDPSAFWNVNFEWNQTSQTESGLVRNSRSWYIHGRVRHGYTNNGEVLASALGPGGNAQFLEISKVQKLNKIGGAIERRVHNNDFAVEAFGNLGSRSTSIRGDYTRYWVQYNIYGFFNHQFDKILLSTSLMFTNSLNHQWEVLFDPNDPSRFPDTPGIDKTNWNLDIKMTYSF